MKKRQIIAAGAILMTGIAASGHGYAQSLPALSPALYLQYGAAEHSVHAWTLGTQIPWKSWHYNLAGGMVTGYWDAWISHWSAPYGGTDRSTWTFGAKPTLRWRPDTGRSPWFAEAGIGMTYAVNRRYITERKEFSTRYNFATHIGVGYLFGERLRNEISLRLEHHSNAGIKRPNPGENFLQLRYARRF